MADALLRPMPPDGLAPRKPPLASAGNGIPAPAAAAPAPKSPMLRPAAFDAKEEEPDLLGGFVIPEEDDDPDDGPDAVDSAAMPEPACVPLFELPQDRTPKSWLISLCAAALLLGAGAYLWWLM